MAIHPGVLTPATDITDQIANPLLLPGRSTASAYAAQADPWTAPLGAWAPGGSELALSVATPLVGASSSVTPSVPSDDHPGVVVSAMGQDWWEYVHALPRIIALGNILSTTDTTIDIYNADRTASRNWTGFDNGAGAGTEMVGLSLPDTFVSQSGAQETFRVTLDGPGEVDDFLGYQFTGQAEVNQSISFTRVLAFPYLPEAGVDETLSWLTDIPTSDDKTEQRIMLRRFPRQTFAFDLQRSSGPERQRVNRRVFDRMHLPWGLPVPTEEVELRVAAVPTDTQIYLDQTWNSDFRVGGSLILYVSETEYETALITTVHPTSIIINSALVGSFPVGTRVMPLRTTLMQKFPWDRHRVNLSEHDVEFLVTDNETYIGQSNFWDTVNGKLLIDDDNFVDGTLPEGFTRPVTVIDNATGVVRQVSRAELTFRSSQKKWSTRSRAELWRIRGLLYDLRGRQKSFYLPTYDQDFTPVDALASGAATMDVTNTGYTDFVQGVHPLDWLRVVKTDGTKIVREISNSSVVSATVEQLTVASNWGENVAVDDIQRVEFLEESRLAVDNVLIQHHGAPGRARIGIPVRTVGA